MIAILIAAASPSAFAQSVYGRCLSRQVVELEPSGERPHDVADAAVQSCVAEAQTYAAENGVGPEIMRQLSRVAADDLAARVVRMRACRKTRICKRDD